MSKKKARKPCPVCKATMSKPNSKFCSAQCKRNNDYREYISRWLSGEVSGNKDGSKVVELSRYVRKYLFEEHDSKCSLCGWGETNPVTGKVPLEVHHIDGDCRNSSPENLQILCPNCHSLTPNFRGRNVGAPSVHLSQELWKKYQGSNISRKALMV